MTYDPKTGEYTIPPAVQAPGASVPNPRTQAPTTIVCFGNEHQLNLAVEQERLGGIFESYPLDSLKQRATMRSAKDFISEHENVLLLGSFPESVLDRDDFERIWRQWTSAVHTNKQCGGSFALIMPKVSEFWHSDFFVKFANDFTFDMAVMDVTTTWLSTTHAPTPNYAIVSDDPYFINQFAGCRRTRDERANPVRPDRDVEIMPEEVAVKVARSWMKSVAFSQMLMQPVLPSGGDAEGEEVPQMPVISANPKHSSRSDRDKHSDGGGLLSSLLLSVQMVAKVLTKQEIANSPKARQAMKDEYYSAVFNTWFACRRGS